EVASPAPGDLDRRRGYRTGPCRAGDARLVTARRRHLAPGNAVSGHYRLGPVPGLEYQPVHALRRLLRPVRLAGLPQPARARRGYRPYLVAPQPAGSARCLAGGLPAPGAAASRRLCPAHLAVSPADL